MPLFEYSGFDAAGKKVSGVIEAAGRRAGVARLHEQGIYPTDLREERQAAGRGRLRAGLQKRRVPPLELASATRQLATLLGAGLPLDEAMETVAGQLEHPLLQRIIGSPEWLRHSNVVRALVCNPKLSIPQIVKLLRHLPANEARRLSKTGRVRASVKREIIKRLEGGR